MLYYMMQAAKREFPAVFRNQPALEKLFDEAISALGQADQLTPYVIMNGGPRSIFANQRKYLDSYVSEANQKVTSIIQELSGSSL